MRYFYSIKTDSDLNLHEEGSLWPDIEAAKAEAIEAAREILADAVLRGVGVSCRGFEILDSGRRTVATLSFEEAVMAENE